MSPDSPLLPSNLYFFCFPLFYFVLFYFILFVLFYFVLFYFILFHFILFYYFILIIKCFHTNKAKQKKRSQMMLTRSRPSYQKISLIVLHLLKLSYHSLVLLKYE